MSVLRYQFLIFHVSGLYMTSIYCTEFGQHRLIILAESTVLVSLPVAEKNTAIVLHIATVVFYRLSFLQKKADLIRSDINARPITCKFVNSISQHEYQ